jgi:hypothetical protein
MDNIIQRNKRFNLKICPHKCHLVKAPWSLFLTIFCSIFYQTFQNFRIIFGIVNNDDSDGNHSDLN